MRRALVLFAHGARDRQWSAPLRELAQRISALAPGLAVRTSFLELEPPHLADVVNELAASHDYIDILPVFWAPAGHVKNELPRLLAACSAAQPHVEFRTLPTLSELPGLLEFVAFQALNLSGAGSGRIAAARPTTVP